MDIIMFEMSGIDVLKEMKKINLNVKVVMILVMG